MASPPRRRALRAGAIAFVFVSAYWLWMLGYYDDDRCRSTQLTPFPCLGGELVVAALGLVAGLVVIACGLAGKGFVHAVLGAFACGAGGLRLGVWATGTMPFLGDDVVAVLVIAVVIATLTGLWAWKVPALGGTGDRSASRSS